MLAFLLTDRVKDAALRGDLGLAVRELLTYGYTLQQLSNYRDASDRVRRRHPRN